MSQDLMSRHGCGTGKCNSLQHPVKLPLLTVESFVWPITKRSQMKRNNFKALQNRAYSDSFAFGRALHAQLC
jgi:hypothetical protein